VSEEQLQSIWKNFLAIIEENIPSQSFKTWFHPIRPLHFENHSLVVEIPNKFFYEWLESHYGKIIDSTLKEVTGTNYKLSYKINKTYNKQYLQSSDPLRGRLIPVLDVESELNKKYQFDNFVEGASNQLAKATSLAVAEAPGHTRFNPLLVYGGAGLGKTHLIQAIGNFCVQERKGLKVRYVSSRKFTVDFISSIKRNETNDFSQQYNSVGLLLMDDIQFFKDKERTQEEFFHAFNTLYQSGKQIVLSSDCPPSELKGVEERLISRFKSGLVVDVQPPDFETRIAILQRKAEEEGHYLGSEITEYIAKNFTSNIRELEGALIRLLAYVSVHGLPLTIEVAKNALKDIIKSNDRHINIEQIQRLVSQYFGIQEDFLRGKTRKQEVVLARMVSMYLSKEFTKNTYRTIGLLHGGRDHSTVIHAIKTIEEQIRIDNSLRESIETLQRKIEYI